MLDDIPPLLKKAIIKTAFIRVYNKTCQYCKRPYPRQHLTIDHIKPRCRGGGETLRNKTLACFWCNQAKADKSLKGEERYRILLRAQQTEPTLHRLIWAMMKDTSFRNGPFRVAA